MIPHFDSHPSIQRFPTRFPGTLCLRYKEELPSAMRQKLIEAKEDIPDQLVEVKLG